MSDIRVIAYRTPQEAARAMDHLIANGISQHDLSVLMSDRTHGAHFSIEEKSKAPEGASTGAAIGGVLGAVAATATAAAGIAVPGVGFLAAGPIMTALAGLGAGAATGGLVGGLTGLGLPEHEAKLYENALSEEAVLLGVNADTGRALELVDELKTKTDPIGVEKS